MSGDEHFYPRSPCGERRGLLSTLPIGTAFLSTLSLRRATVSFMLYDTSSLIFLSTLSLRRATGKISSVLPGLTFLSTLSLRRATSSIEEVSKYVVISIHALLAESDDYNKSMLLHLKYFYPRSPCGERPSRIISSSAITTYFYPRSPCGERLGRGEVV